MDNGYESVIPALALPKGQKPKALDVVHGKDEVKSKFYWVEQEKLRLQRADWNSSNVETLIDGFIVSLHHDLYEAFAVDWTTGNIYLTTSVSLLIEDMSEGTSNIIVYNQNMEYFQVILQKSPRVIGGLVLAPTLGMMYWHDHDIDLETLWSAKMDGSEPEQFYEFSHHPHIRSLTYSKEQHQLYWICCQNRQIQRYIFFSQFQLRTYAFNPNFVICH